MAIALVIFISVLMPALAVYYAWSAGSGGKLAFVLKLVGAMAFMAFLHLVARWDWLSVYLPWLWWALLAAAGVASLVRVKDRDWVVESRGRLIAAAFEPLIGLLLLGYAGSAFLHPPGVSIASPLRGGAFHVGQGGNSAALNYHNTNAAQRYALDIVALDGWGKRADGLIPTDLADYNITGMEVASPCDGSVLEVVDGIADNAIDATNRDAPAGNHVVIACNGLEILLAHLQPGSVAVAAEETVATGSLLGRVGNSGNSTEPHLHVHAVRENSGGVLDGDAVPLIVDGIFPVRGTVLHLS